MRKRAAALKPKTNGVRVTVVLVDDAARMVTLDDPAAGVHEAQGAFARLKVPEDLGPVETDVWRRSVAAVARAYRVLPPPRSAVLAAVLSRGNTNAMQGVREEALALARAAGDPELLADVERTLSEVG